MEAGQGTAPEIKHNGTAPGDQEDADIRPRRAAGTQDQTDSGPAGTEEDEKVDYIVCACSYNYVCFRSDAVDYITVAKMVIPVSRDLHFCTVVFYIAGVKIGYHLNYSLARETSLVYRATLIDINKIVYVLLTRIVVRSLYLA